MGQIERQDALVSKASADPPVVATDGGARALIRSHDAGFIIQAGCE